MPDSGALAAIGLLAVLTFASRAAGAALLAGRPISSRIARLLDALATSVIAGLVAAMLVTVDAREFAAAGVAALVMAASRSPTGAMLAGVAVAALWSLVPAG